MDERVSVDLTGWQVRENVNQQALYSFLECVMQIAQSLRGLLGEDHHLTVGSREVQAPLLVAASRNISVSIRKILLERHALLKRCFADPAMHPLKPITNNVPSRFKRHFEEQTIILGMTDGVSKSFTMPAFTHVAKLYPLHGVEYVGGMQFRLFNPFNHDAEPVKVNRWMNVSLLEIDGRAFKVEHVLREMSNKEGAHIEDNPTFLLPASLNIDHDKSALHRSGNGLRFGGLTYLQLFSIFTGLYIVNRTRAVLDNLPFAKDNQAVEVICQIISQTPRSITTEKANIELNSFPLAVLGWDWSLRGDYSAGITTIYRSPDIGPLG